MQRTPDFVNSSELYRKISELRLSSYDRSQVHVAMFWANIVGDLVGSVLTLLRARRATHKPTPHVGVRVLN